MPFDHHAYNTLYVENARQNGEPINDATAYGVRIIKADVAEDEIYWKIIGIHHLLPQENIGNHNVFLEALDEDGNRVTGPFAWAGWTWEGRRPDERADPVPLDKPDFEPAGNIAMHFSQTVSTWLLGRSREAEDITDGVENLHTRHPDEAPGNTLGHHSFYVVFQETRKQSGVFNGVILGRIENGQNHTLQLLIDGEVLEEQLIGPDLNYRFEKLRPGTYALRVTGTGVGQDGIVLDEDNPTVNVDLVVPPPSNSSIFGQVTNGAGKTLLLNLAGTVVDGQIIPIDEDYRFEGLAAGVYGLRVSGTTVGQDSIILDGVDSQEVNLVVSDGGIDPPEKTIEYYVLFGPPGTRGRQTNLLLSTNYLLAFSITAGFSVTDAMQARFVTIIGDGVSPEEQQAILESGSVLEVLAGDAYDIEAELNRRIENGVAFRGQDQD
jgi:hypothetical protein